MDGTTNLDVVDIDGAVQIDNTLTVGVDDTGHDVKFFGATGGSYLLWDESADDLILAGAGGIVVAGDVTFNSTGGAKIPAGTTAQRPSAVTGMFRFNSTDTTFEGYDGSAWGPLAGGGGPSLGTDAIIRTNAKVIAENITFAGNENGSTVGPVTINASYTVTVTNGSTWVII